MPQWASLTVFGRIKMADKSQISIVRRHASLSRKVFAGGRPRTSAPRCDCGAMTAKRAATRKHLCGTGARITA